MSSTPRLEEVLRNIDKIAPDKTREQTPKGKTSVGVGLRPIRFQNILVAYDGSEGAQDALDWAQSIARHEGSRVIVALVLPPTPEVWGGALTGVSEDTRESINAILHDDELFGRKMLDAARRELKNQGVECQTILVEGQPKQEIPVLAQRYDVDLIVMGSHERSGLDRVTLGSVSNAVKDRTDVSVLIARSGPIMEHVLLAVDGSSVSRRAAAVLVGLIEGTNAKAHVLHVHPWPFAGLSTKQNKTLEKTADRLKGLEGTRFEDPEAGMDYSILYGKPAQRIVDESVEKNAGLVVMGARGLSAFKGLMLGSVSNQVVHDAQTSVLIVRDGEGQTHPESEQEKGPMKSHRQ